MTSTNRNRDPNTTSLPAGHTAQLQQTVSYLLVFLAILLRARQYFFNRSLWLDEAMLAVNIVNRGFVDLFKPLEHNQSAPIGFLLVEKLFLKLFGNHDYVLRLYPFLAGLAAVLIMAWLAKRLFPGWTGLLAFGLFAFSGPAVYYASEVKQYGSDLLFTLILLAAASACSAAIVPRRNWLWLMGTGTVALWMSHPALFTITAIVIVLGIVNVSKKNRRHVFWLAISCLFWALNFIGLYFLSLSHTAASKMLANYWHKSFMPLPPWNDLSWFWRSSEMVIAKLLNIPHVLGLAILAIGIFFMFRHQRKRAALWLLPILAALLASSGGKYPFWPRFLLFALPMFCFCFSTGMQALHTQAKRFFPKAGIFFSILIVIVILFQPITMSADKFMLPENRNDIKSIMAHLRAKRRLQDTIYVHGSSRFQFMYYASFYGINHKKAVFGKRVMKSTKPLRKDVATLAGRRRVWFLFAYRMSRDKVNQEKAMLKYLKRSGVQRMKFEATGARLYLYDLRRDHLSSPGI